MLCNASKAKQKKTQKLQRPKLCYHAKLHGKLPFGTEKLRLEPRRVTSHAKVTGEKLPLSRSGFPADIPDPYARTPLGQKVSPHRRGRRKTYFSVWTSTIFGADIRDPKGSRKILYKKTLYKKSLR